MIRVDIIDALKSLAPGASWEYLHETDTLNWFSDDIKKPTTDEINAEITRLTAVAEEEELARAAAAIARDLAKESALAKLALLGLTEEEAKAVIGMS